jgi:RimJ/RimL family protein N-acetyltransferase
MTNDFKIQLVGKKIHLREWSLSDLFAYEHWQKPEHKWQSLNGPYYLNPIDQSKKLAHELKLKIEQNNFPTPRSQLVIADIENDQILGVVTCYWESIETNWLCIGIIIYDSEKSWGKGIGFEAMKLWIDYLFLNHPQIVRLDMRTWSGNIGLIKLAHKLGFIQEACFRKARIVDNKYYDGLGFGILREEWISSKSSIGLI